MDTANTREQFQAAMDHIADGRRVEARDILTGILEDTPDYLEARLALGVLMGGEGEVEPARRHLRFAMEQLALNPAVGSESLRAQVLVNLCALALEQDDYADVLAWEDVFGEMSEALSRQGLSERAASLLFDAGGRAIQADEPSHGQRLYMRAAELEPGFSEAWYNIAVIAAEDEAYPEAKVALRRAIDADHGFADAHFLLGTLLLSDSTAEAAECMSRAVELKPENPRWVTMAGSAYARLREFAKAREWFRRSLAMDDDQADAHLGYAVACRALGDLGAARGSLQKAFDLNPALATQIQGMMAESE
jgi:tetratricopeptide (TPR) repeat protein